MIGIVGGMGPYSGIDLLKKVFDNTTANLDQDHIDTVLLTLPSSIKDRTAYLEGKIQENPAFAIAKVLLKLEKAGATIAGIPCNTAHAEAIFNEITLELQCKKSKITVLNMITEALSFIHHNYPEIKNIGVLSTTGTYKKRIYSKALLAKGYQVVLPTLEMQENIIHQAIYNTEYGIKAVYNPIHPKAKENLILGIDFLKEQGAQAIILGCTEIPLAITEYEDNTIVIIDPTTILARALIQKYNPNKLKSLSQ